MADAVAGTDAAAGDHPQPGRAAHALAQPAVRRRDRRGGRVPARAGGAGAVPRRAPDQIIIDPGHDLNKNTYHSLELTRRLDEIAAIGYPMLAAVSNKDFIGETLDAAQHERLAGTLAAVVFCVLHGARIVRVHDVAAAVDAVRMTEAMLGWRAPAYTRHNI
jgi:dihydropteroate synthase